MKAKVLITILAIVFLIFLIYYSFNRLEKIPEVAKYEVISEKGKRIPAKLYSRLRDGIVENDTGFTYEYILVLDNDLVNHREDSTMTGKYYIIVPEEKMIGFMWHADKIKEKNGYINYPKNLKEERYGILIVDTIIHDYFFTNPLISRASFTSDKIVFNSFGKLKQYGDSVIIKLK